VAGEEEHPWEKTGTFWALDSTTRPGWIQPVHADSTINLVPGLEERGGATWSPQWYGKYLGGAVYDGNLNRTIFVKYSPFNVTYWQDFPYWTIQPASANQSNIEPYGQNSSHGIWKVESFAYDGNIDIYSRYNNTENLTCVTQMEFRGQNFSVNSLNNISTLNITNLTTSNQPIISDLNSSLTGNIRTYTQINCSEYGTSAILIPYFCFNSRCSNCVETSDFTDDCEVVR